MTFENSSAYRRSAHRAWLYRAHAGSNRVIADEALARLGGFGANCRGKTVAFGLAMRRRFSSGGLVSLHVSRCAPLLRRLVTCFAGESRTDVALWQSRCAHRDMCGGMDASKERRHADTRRQDVVGTPGRLRDHLERGALDLSALKVAILDEADEMLDMGFREELKKY